ncbi:MAG TPA: PilZ domain-containing protein [Spirochaetota bacterium]|nr:PilZ domain-containing protein [Spirochaetota bacterium]
MIYGEKKVFFLYPTREFEDHTIKKLVSYEYEVHPLFDYRNVYKLLGFFDYSILFINLDYNEKSLSWKDYIRELLNSPDFSHTLIGAYCVEDSRFRFDTELSTITLAEKYYDMTNTGCIDPAAMSGILERNCARGGRKYVRAKCNSGTSTMCNIKIGKENYNGRIHDISICGMACIFEKEVHLPRGREIDDIQLRLKSHIYKTKGIVYGHRDMGKENLVVFLFDKESRKTIQETLYLFIYETLQKSLSRLMETL